MNRLVDRIEAAAAMVAGVLVLLVVAVVASVLVVLVAPAVVAGGLAAAAVVLVLRRRRTARERADAARIDAERTARLLDALDAWAQSEPSAQFEDGSFELVLVSGLGCDRACASYPPQGHGYPRGDR